MSVTHVVTLLSNDELDDVISKCNYNFNLIMKSQSATKLKDAKDVDEKINGVLAELVTLSGEVAAVSTAVTNLQTTVTGHGTAIAALQTAVTALQGRVATLEATVADHEQRIQALEEA